MQGNSSNQDDRLGRPFKAAPCVELSSRNFIYKQMHIKEAKKMVWILFFFIVFMILRSERFKREFHNNF